MSLIMERFYTDYIMQEKPVILEECMTHWPALTKWTDNNYFINLAGLRTVSIEIGKEYTDSEWTQKLITMKEFIETYIYQNKGPTGYLAQYPLFTQIPELHEDIIEPEYCSFAETDDGVNIMAWYGPKGTVSPLHHDPTKNLLAQVVGEKKIYLFSPNDSENLYPYESELLDNTARVDPRIPDLNKYPKYQDAKAYYCVLKPGQMLFIPPKWWHFVESLSISFSVSFWWT
ncbi:lysine-specific demethylase 8 isoform X2 [Pieris brassicae]|uniref:lysine-specific demethylase 8 isoform X2 n=1 Tax=Pieris brassicae TaxID=7116 RepID=UPI001E661588|nr:lysine-specific demethylase 8 isoform X2 [Pieris brassicae]